jgi:hypothetical protein
MAFHGQGPAARLFPLVYATSRTAVAVPEKCTPEQVETRVRRGIAWYLPNRNQKACLTVMKRPVAALSFCVPHGRFGRFL